MSLRARLLSVIITARPRAGGVQGISTGLHSGPFQRSGHAICIHLCKLCICVQSSLTRQPNEATQRRIRSRICREAWPAAVHRPNGRSSAQTCTGGGRARGPSPSLRNPWGDWATWGGGGAGHVSSFLEAAQGTWGLPRPRGPWDNSQPGRPALCLTFLARAPKPN